MLAEEVSMWTITYTVDGFMVVAPNGDDVHIPYEEAYERIVF